MCYNITFLTKKNLIYAKRLGRSEEDIAELNKKLKLFGEKYFPKYHSDGFAHEDLLVFTNEAPLTPQFFRWGLVPFWTKNEADAIKFANQTLNARGETIFEKPSFRGPAKKRRCVILVDNFFEHHHFNNKTYPFLIKLKNDEPMILAGLWDVWINKETGEEIKTVTIVTTEGNSLLAKIHNNPKLSGPRMPVLLHPETIEKWLMPIRDKIDQEEVQSLIQPYPSEELAYYTVRRLRGNNSVGNVPEALQQYVYAEVGLL